MKKRKFLLAGILTLTMLFTGSSVFALTLADIELLVALGIVSSERAELAKQAIGISSVAGSAGGGTAGSSVRNSEFSNVQCLILNQNLIPGLSGSAVSALQRFLQAQGHYAHPTITGQYGPITQTAVTDFQIRTGLITSSTQLGAGSVGPLTRQKIQEISCGAVNQEFTEQQQAQGQVQAQSQAGLFERRERPVFQPAFTLPVELEPVEVKFTSRLTLENTEKGTRMYKYAMSIKPDDNIKWYRLTLVCDEDQIEVNRKDLEKCGDIATFKASSKGTASVKIEYTNKANGVQTVGMGVEALDEDENVLAEAEVIDQVPAAKPKPVARNESGFQIIDGRAVPVNIPEQRLCSEDEQLDYLRYIMTRTIRDNDPLLPPLCWPGNVQCTFDSPPSFCLIAEGPNSDDLCEAGERFYDGRCLAV